MSGDSGVVAVVPREESAEGVAGPDVGAVMDALGDPDCRRVLGAIGAEARTAAECSSVCDLPLSTAYRKLGMLAEAGLVAERLRIRRDGKHASEYRRRVASVRIDVGADGDLALDMDPAPTVGR